ncbi:hypothetical protein [Jatrophihabitans fulvus]
MTPEQARRTLADLDAAFAPFEVTALGWTLWRYDGGPWTHLADVPFTAAGPRASR